MFFFITSHPLLLVLTLIIQTIPIIITIVYNLENRWLRYILFLIFLGGLLIIFIYLSALVPNEIFNPLRPYAFLPLGGLLIRAYYFFSPNQKIESRARKIIEFRTNNLSTTIPLIITYLLIALCVAIFMCVHLKRPLKQNI